jgi:tRNA threonylcarbamoyl adenosine modification protein YeaZ
MRSRLLSTPRGPDQRRSSLVRVLVLTLDTSTPAVTAAVSRLTRPEVEGGWFASPRSMVETLAAHTEVATNRHGELLAPMIESVLADAAAMPRDLAAVGVGLGPGPFTGLRVGIMTAAALGDALGIPVYGECSLDILGSWPLYSPTTVVADARRKQVYWATYDHGRRVDGPDIDFPDALAGRLRAGHDATSSDRPHRVVGAGAGLYACEFEEFRLDRDQLYPAAAELAVLLWQKVTAAAPGDDLTPLYLRRPDATPPGRPKQVTPA